MIKTASLRVSCAKQEAGNPGRKHAVAPKPFAPHTSSPAHHEVCTAASTSGASWGIHSAHPHSPYPPQRPRQLLVHLPHEYRRGVGLCVVNRSGRVFAAKRRDDTEGTWQMPQGGIDPDESPVDAALRELKEETGMESVKIVASMDKWLNYDFSTQVRAQLDGPWLRYRGQTQKWFLVQYLGQDDSEIDLACHGEPEFSEFTWMHLDHLPERVVSFKQHVYREVQQHFAPRISQLMTNWHHGAC